jgi:hypothetical protein
MSSAALKTEADDVLSLADEAIGRISVAHFEAAAKAVVALQAAAQRISAEPDRDLAIDNLLDALKDVEVEVRPIGQSVARRIIVGTQSLILEREVQIKSKHALVLNAVEMHLASLIMSIKRKMICGRLPLAANLLANLAALRVQLPPIEDPNDKRGDEVEVKVVEDSPKGKVIQSWSERLARRFMGR